MVVGRIVDGDMTSVDREQIDGFLRGGWLVQHAVPADKCVVFVLETSIVTRPSGGPVQVSHAHVEGAITAFDNLVAELALGRMPSTETVQALAFYRDALRSAAERSR